MKVSSGCWQKSGGEKWRKRQNNPKPANEDNDHIFK